MDRLDEHLPALPARRIGHLGLAFVSQAVLPLGHRPFSESRYLFLLLDDLDHVGLVVHLGNAEMRGNGAGLLSLDFRDKVQVGSAEGVAQTEAEGACRRLEEIDVLAFVSKRIAT